MTGEIEIIEYQSRYQPRFKAINEQWIKRSHVLEEEDIRTLEDPEGYVIKNGGRIFLALYQEKIVGTCAYLNFGQGEFEMIKMAVDEAYRGLGIGSALCRVTISRMRGYGAKKIILFSNTIGSRIAIELYKKLGFKAVPLGNPEFKRADIRMELVLA
jgi:putative acetyltransferase